MFEALDRNRDPKISGKLGVDHNRSRLTTLIGLIPFIEEQGFNLCYSLDLRCLQESFHMGSWSVLIGIR